MASAGALYTPEMLALATGLANYPLDDAMPLRSEARSKSCGSTIEVGVATDATGAIERIGLRAHSCAVGQAAAALFAAHAPGLDRSRVEAAHDDIAAWLAGTDNVVPDWPGLAILDAARSYPARHGAIMLAWRAALTALSATPAAR